MSEPQTQASAAAEPPQNRSALSELARRGRVLFFAGAFAAELALFFGATLVPIDPVQQQELVRQASNLLGSASSQGSFAIFLAIFANNVRVALLEMVPVGGAALFVTSIFTTGQVIQALSISSNLPGPVFGLLLFFFPFAIIELSAYAIAVASGTLILVALWRRRLVRELKTFVLEGAVVVLALAIAAAMETVGIVAPIEGFALWLPTALGLFALVMVVRRVWK